MMTKTNEQQITETEKKLKELKQKKFNEDSKKDFVYIKELGIDVQKEIHHRGKSYDELVEEFGEEFLEENLLTYKEIQDLRNLENKGKYKLGLIDTWEFIKQEDEIFKRNGYVARFVADSDDCGLLYIRDSGNSDSDLGVRFVKRIKESKK